VWVANTSDQAVECRSLEFGHVESAVSGAI
jgi:hypothetical protein